MEFYYYREKMPACLAIIAVIVWFFLSLTHPPPFSRLLTKPDTEFNLSRSIPHSQPREGESCLLDYVVTNASSFACELLKARTQCREVGPHQSHARVPGSNKLSSPEAVGDFRCKQHCVSNAGRWRFDDRPRPLPFPPDSTVDIDLCDTRHLKSGSGMLVGRRANDYAMRNSTPEGWKVRDSLKYVWEPDVRCGSWVAFERAGFCSSVAKANGSVFFVGDSLTHLFWLSLRDHMMVGGLPHTPGWPVPLHPRECRKLERINHGQMWCEGMTLCSDTAHAIPFYLIRNDRLLLNSEPSVVNRSYFAPWLHLLREWDVRVLVLNRGAHWVQDGDLIAELNNTLQSIRNVSQDVLIIFRNTAPGHYHCRNISRPLEFAQDAKILPEVYHWGEFHNQNSIMRGLVESVGGIYMDIEYMTSLRGDGHLGLRNRRGNPTVDCLHYCLPGPPDVWVQSLYNILLDGL